MAAPPDVAADVVVASLSRWPTAVVTDVASVKGSVADAVRDGGGDLTRYVGSHPMAGRERSGAGAARGDLFDGRAWVVVPTDQSRPDAVDLVAPGGHRRRLGGQRHGAGEHDAAVAVVSHVPQVAASLVAGRLRDVSDPAVALAGQGLRDVTRIAASDPRLWTQILAGNAAAVRDVLTALRADLDEVIGALDQLADGDSRGALEVRQPHRRPGQRRASRGSRASTARPPPHTRPSSSSSRTRPARWAGCSPTWARPASTSRTSTSSTGSGSRSGWPRWPWSPERWRSCSAARSTDRGWRVHD